MTGRGYPAAGFTLVEVVVALAILSMVMLGTVTALRTLANTQIAVERQTERVDEIRSVSSFLRDTMETTVIGGGGDGLSLGGGAGQTAYFSFGEGFVEWKSTVLFGESYGGSHFVRIGEEEGQLVLRWQAPTPTGYPDDWKTAPSRVLVKELEEFEMSVRQDYGEDWDTQWRSNSPPVAVRVQIKSAGRYWPELIMQVQQ